MKAAGFFSLATSKCPPGKSTAPSPRDPFGSDHACAISLRPSTARSIDATTFNALGSMSSTRGGVSWSSKTRPRPSAQTASIWESRLGSIEPESFAMLLVCQSIRPHRCAAEKTRRSSPPDRRPRSETSDRFRDASKYQRPREVARRPRGALAAGSCSTTVSHGRGFLRTSRRTYNHLIVRGERSPVARRCVPAFNAAVRGKSTTIERGCDLLA